MKQPWFSKSSGNIYQQQNRIPIFFLIIISQLYQRYLPKGGGAIRGIGEKFGTNPVTGTASVSVPIFTSPGCSGFGPSLSLSTTPATAMVHLIFGGTSLPSTTCMTDKGCLFIGMQKKNKMYSLKFIKVSRHEFSKVLTTFGLEKKPMTLAVSVPVGHAAAFNIRDLKSQSRKE